MIDHCSGAGRYSNHTPVSHPQSCLPLCLSTWAHMDCRAHPVQPWVSNAPHWQQQAVCQEKNMLLTWVCGESIALKSISPPKTTNLFASSLAHRVLLVCSGRDSCRNTMKERWKKHPDNPRSSLWRVLHSRSYPEKTVCSAELQRTELSQDKSKKS